MIASSPRKPEGISARNNQLQTSTLILHALAHPLRMQIVDIIGRDEPVCVNQIYASLRIEQSVASQHLRILRQSHLVQTKRDGKFVYYSLNHEKMAGAAHAARSLAMLLPEAGKGQK
jgi:ArsR family transcriptional regulator